MRYEKIYNGRFANKDKKKFDTMYPKGTKIHTYDVYLYALTDYLKRKKGIELYIGTKDNMLYPKLSAYFA